MSELQLCEHCQRHIRASESACPFCGEASSFMRASVRAAIFAGALVGATALGCSESKPKAEAPPTKAEPAHVIAIDATPVVAAVSDAAPPDPVDAGAVDAATAVKKKRKVKHEPKELPPADVRPPPMPYGAPPARRRLV